MNRGKAHPFLALAAATLALGAALLLISSRSGAAVATGPVDGGSEVELDVHRGGPPLRF